MKNTFKIFGIIALTVIIGFSFTACDSDGGGGGTTGGLTITGLGTYNGQYAYATSASLVGVSSSGKTALISNGSVVLTVYNSASVYTGNDTVTFSVAIYDTEVAPGQSMGSPVTSGGLTVTFSNGKASGSFTAP
ncbi:MAG: hypothetical protein FWB86_08040 [Treponema sp.]|nr:hypothetical protein [Treponema sp.]MCL2251933.1 hypothetical protein [Treponema sp.]